MLNIQALLALLFVLAHQCSSVPITLFHSFGPDTTLDKTFTQPSQISAPVADYPGKIDLLAPCEDVQRYNVRIYIHITETRMQLLLLCCTIFSLCKAALSVYTNSP